MSITFSAQQLIYLAQVPNSYCYCVRLKNLRITSYFSSLTLPDGTYTAHGKLFEIDLPRLDSVVDRDLYNITLTDSAFDMGSDYETGFLGAPAEVRIVFIDKTTNQPDTSEPFLIYKGIVSNFNYEVDTSEQGRVISKIGCSNPMADLDTVKPLYTSKDFLRQFNPNDSSFDQIYEGSGAVNLKWGKR